MSSKGFTIIELLVAIFIFVLIITTAIGIFVSVIQQQRRALVKQELLNQTSYVIEYMSRALRMAKKELNCINPSDPSTCNPSNPSHCLTNKGYGWNYEINPPYNDEIKFINHLEDDVCQEFYWDKSDNLLKESKEGEILPLISNKFQVNSLKFNLSGESQDDGIQPRVTIFLEIQAKGIGDQPKMKIQATISQRNLDVKSY